MNIGSIFAQPQESFFQRGFAGAVEASLTAAIHAMHFPARSSAVRRSSPFHLSAQPVVGLSMAARCIKGTAEAVPYIFCYDSSRVNYLDGTDFFVFLPSSWQQ